MGLEREPLGLGGGIRKICIMTTHEPRLNRPSFRFTEHGGGSFSNASLRPLFLSRRLEKLFPHVVCRRRPLELFAAAGGARTRTQKPKEGESPKTRHEFLSGSASGSLRHARAAESLAGTCRKAGIESRTPITQPSRWGQSGRMPPSEWIGCRSGSGGRVVMRYSSFNPAACAASSAATLSSPSLHPFTRVK